MNDFSREFRNDIFLKFLENKYVMDIFIKGYWDLRLRIFIVVLFNIKINSSNEINIDFF